MSLDSNPHVPDHPSSHSERMTDWIVYTCPIHGSYRVRVALRNWENGARTYALEYAPLEEEQPWTEDQRNVLAANGWKQLLEAIEAMKYGVN